MKNKAAAVILNFFLRAVMGICLIYFVNQYVLPDQDSWKVGINGLSFLTSGSLGIPGVCMLYGFLMQPIPPVLYDSFNLLDENTAANRSLNKNN